MLRVPCTPVCLSPRKGSLFSPKHSISSSCGAIWRNHEVILPQIHSLLHLYFYPAVFLMTYSCKFPFEAGRQTWGHLSRKCRPGLPLFAKIRFVTVTCSSLIQHNKIYSWSQHPGCVCECSRYLGVLIINLGLQHQFQIYSMQELALVFQLSSSPGQIHKHHAKCIERFCIVVRRSQVQGRLISALL